MSFLEVSFREEFYKDKIGPQFAQIPRLRRVGNVWQVEHESDAKFFIFGFGTIEIFITHPTVQMS